jgi:hypothetical protein
MSVLMFLEKLFATMALDAEAVQVLKTAITADHLVSLLLLAKQQSPSATAPPSMSSSTSASAPAAAAAAATTTPPAAASAQVTSSLRAVFHTLFITDLLDETHEMTLLAQLGLDDTRWPLFVPREQLVPLSRLAVKRLKRYGCEEALVVSLWDGFLESLQLALQYNANVCPPSIATRKSLSLSLSLSLSGKRDCSVLFVLFSHVTISVDRLLP